MNRFFQQPQNGKAVLSKEDAHHLTRVLRKNTGDTLEIAWEGCAWEGSIESVSPCVIALGKPLPSTEPPYALHLIQAIAKGDKMDWIIQKAVELGVTSIQPVRTEHGDVKLDGPRAQKRSVHWQNVAEAAAKQSKRCIIPKVEEIRSLQEALTRYGHLPQLVFHKKAEAASWPQPGPAVVWIGPEGGFSAAEIMKLTEAGAQILSLGPRILRTETAGLCALSVLQYNNGAFV